MGNEICSLKYACWPVQVWFMEKRKELSLSDLEDLASSLYDRLVSMVVQ